MMSTRADIFALVLVLHKYFILQASFVHSHTPSCKNFLVCLSAFNITFTDIHTLMNTLGATEGSVLAQEYFGQSTGHEPPTF